MAPRRPISIGIISEDDTKSVLGPDNHDRLFRTVTRAFERMQEGQVGLTKLPHTGHLTNTMHALMVDEARDRFSDVEDVEIIEGLNFLLKFGSSLLVRFKKIDRELRTSNYPTSRSRAFDAQLSLADVPPLPRVTVGYETDEVWSELVSVAVVFSRHRGALWNYELTGRSENVHALSPLSETVVVKPKKQLSLDDVVKPKKPR